MRKKQKKLTLVTASILTAHMLATTTLVPAMTAYGNTESVDHPTIEVKKSVALDESSWPEWSGVKSGLPALDATNKQVKYKNKIYQAKWWVGASATEEPGSGEEYTTGWAEVGNIASNGKVTLNSGISPHPYEGTTSGGNTGSETDESTPYTNIDAGKGHIWEDHVFSPYIDSGLWYNNDNGGGLFPIGDIVDKAKMNYANLGFIVADPHALKDGDVIPSFAGAYNVDGTGTQSATVSAFSKQVKKFREKGGDIMVSFGGENGTPLHAAYDNAEELANKYIEIIQGWGLTAIDFDIEGSHVRDTASWKRNNEALKIVQEKLGESTPDIWFTFPVLPTGLVNSQDANGEDSDAYNVLKDAVKSGINVQGVNIMAMCFGPSFVPNATTEYNKYVIEASESLKGQIMDIYSSTGHTISEEEAYQKIGLTPWIGKSTQANETFTQSDATAVSKYAQDKGLGMLSFWSLNRDQDLSEDLNNTGLEQNPFEFSNIFSDIEKENSGGEVNQRPTFSGITNITIEKGSTFDPKAGVTAIDKENGDLTSQIKITGTVDTKSEGTYELLYSVEDSTDQKTTMQRIITVGEKPVNDKAPEIKGANDKSIKVGDTFDPKAGVTAIDKEDGDLTSKVKITGTVNTGKEGKYQLTYSVEDSANHKSEVKCTIEVKKAPSPSEDFANEMVNPYKDVMVGYWHNWDSRNDGYKQGTAVAMDLTDIDTAYNVIDVSFMKSDDSSKIPTFEPYNMTDVEFRQQVSELNKQGRSVILALGGADAHISLTSGDKSNFVKEIIRLVDTYGFDGLDLDLEQSAITAAENQKVIPEALKEVRAHYAKENKNFLITMAPELPYLTKEGAYTPYLDGLKDDYAWINPQYYNQGSWGVWAEDAVDAEHPWGTQVTLSDTGTAKEKEDGIYYITKGLINGKYGLTTIPADKLVIGLPSNRDAAGSGYVNDKNIISHVLKKLHNDNTPIKGLMTWSVNWDNGKDSTGKGYNWNFAHTYEDLIDYDKK